MSVERIDRNTVSRSQQFSEFRVTIHDEMFSQLQPLIRNCSQFYLSRHHFGDESEVYG